MTAFYANDARVIKSVAHHAIHQKAAPRENAVRARHPLVILVQGEFKKSVVRHASIAKSGLLSLT
jgi:hypothetical protein